MKTNTQASYNCIQDIAYRYALSYSLDETKIKAVAYCPLGNIIYFYMDDYFYMSMDYSYPKLIAKHDEFEKLACLNAYSSFYNSNQTV